jgi:hypothetical protein
MSIKKIGKENIIILNEQSSNKLHHCTHKIHNYLSFPCYPAIIVLSHQLEHWSLVYLYLYNVSFSLIKLLYNKMNYSYT